jgi:hypothetical protein
MSFYQYYGLTVCSDLPLPELVTLPEADKHVADIQIHRSIVTEGELPQGEYLGPFLQAQNRQLWLSVPNIARFLISNGNEIIYDPIAGSDEDSIRVFLLGVCTGALLLQRGSLVLHGSAFEVNDHCVICVGNSGIGKSTLAIAMAQRNHKVLADDVCLINSGSFAIPGIPHIKLWQDSADKLMIDTSSLKRVRPLLEKFYFPLNKSFCNNALPVKSIYILDSHNTPSFSLKTVKGMDKYTFLRNHTYRLNYLKGMHMETQHLRNCSSLANRIHVSHLYRPRGNFQLDELADLILADIEETTSPNLG